MHLYLNDYLPLQGKIPTCSNGLVEQHAIAMEGLMVERHHQAGRDGGSRQPYSVIVESDDHSMTVS